MAVVATNLRRLRSESTGVRRVTGAPVTMAMAESRGWPWRPGAVTVPVCVHSKRLDETRDVAHGDAAHTPSSSVGLALGTGLG